MASQNQRVLNKIERDNRRTEIIAKDAAVRDIVSTYVSSVADVGEFITRLPPSKLNVESFPEVVRGVNLILENTRPIIEGVLAKRIQSEHQRSLDAQMASFRATQGNLPSFYANTIQALSNNRPSAGKVRLDAFKSSEEKVLQKSISGVTEGEQDVRTMVQVVKDEAVAGNVAAQELVEDAEDDGIALDPRIDANINPTEVNGAAIGSAGNLSDQWYAVNPDGSFTNKNGASIGPPILGDLNEREQRTVDLTPTRPFDPLLDEIEVLMNRQPHTAQGLARLREIQAFLPDNQKPQVDMFLKFYEMDLPKNVKLVAEDGSISEETTQTQINAQPTNAFLVPNIFDGLTLSDRIWTPGKKEQILQIIFGGFRNGDSPFAIAEALSRFSTEGGGFNNAFRLAYTELTNIYAGSAVDSVRAWNNDPEADFKIFIQQYVSPTHFKFDICDVFAGTYDPSTDIIPAITRHPNCNCGQRKIIVTRQNANKFTTINAQTHAFKDEIIASNINLDRVRTI